jgi:hypothetical protein
MTSGSDDSRTTALWRDGRTPSCRSHGGKRRDVGAKKRHSQPIQSSSHRESSEWRCEFRASAKPVSERE